ncbi:tyrosine-type recombinase/integrase [Phytohabitans kaempferiae]|uniref:Tyrosine-type recombinase/integrase n=1 Tax=Phytohabitans kaempferiae TaxID=1620943 RepID=A0ABV6LZH0_9ACTN
MASVNKDPTRKRTPWVVRWRDESNTLRKKGFARKVDADRYRAEIEHSLNIGSYVDPVAGKETFRSYGEKWRLAQPHRPNTVMRTKSQLHRHAYPALGDKPMAGIRQSTLQAFVTGVDLAPSSVRPLWATVRAIFGAAHRDRIIGQDPTLGVKLPELPHKEVVPLLLEQVDALVTAVDPRYRALVEVDAGTGLRQGEAFGLEVSHVDFLRRSAKVCQQVQPAAGGGVVVCAPKNQYSYRTMPLGQAVIDRLAAHLKEFPAREVEVLDTTADPAGKRAVRRTARFIFADASGNPLHRNDFNETIWGPARRAAAAAFRALAKAERDADKAAGLRQRAAQLGEVGMHDLRHLFASMLIAGGLSPKAVARLLGHKDASVTLRVYSHLWPDDEDRARQAVDAAFGRDVPTVRPSLEAVR